MSVLTAGVDVGGTFTDAVVIDRDGAASAAKVSSDPEGLDGAVLSAIRSAAPTSSALSIGSIAHGTTVATNATLERRGPRTALICTEGFRDVLELGRLNRPPGNLYRLKEAVPAPLIPRRDCFEVPGRLDRDGREVEPLDREAVAAIARALADRGIEDVAICFLFAYRNPAHERLAREVLLNELPGISATISSEVWPEFQEYERASTTALNAYLRGAVGGYMDALGAAVDDAFPDASLWVMQSHGGLTSPQSAADYPVRLVLSGPAGGVMGARQLAHQTGIGNLIAADMGGTSFDVSLLREGEPGQVPQQRVMDLPIKGPAVDILTLGAGGGSIAWIDGGGQFRVGPHSAGAFPGPTCYGRGGTEPTVTDANAVLGYFAPSEALAGGLDISREAAEEAVARLGAEVDLDPHETAWGIRRIVATAMAGAVRAVSVARGADPREFALLAYGGAGPLHAVDIAREMDVREVIVPPLSGCFSAFGMCASDAAHELVETLNVGGQAGADTVAEALDRLRREGRKMLDEHGIPPASHRYEEVLDMCYEGQNFALSVPVGSANLGAARRRFDAMHERLYGYDAPAEPVTVVNARVRAVGTLSRPGGEMALFDPAEAEPHGERSASLEPGALPSTMPVYRREDLTAGEHLPGPAMIDAPDTTILVPNGASAKVDGLGNLRIATGVR